MADLQPTEELLRALKEIDKVLAVNDHWPPGHALAATLTVAEARALRTALGQELFDRASFDQITAERDELEERTTRLERTLREIRDLFTVDQWWRGNRAEFVVKLIDSALAREEALRA